MQEVNYLRQIKCEDAHNVHHKFKLTCLKKIGIFNWNLDVHMAVVQLFVKHEIINYYLSALNTIKFGELVVF